jgi:hypothetical protein
VKSCFQKKEKIKGKSAKLVCEYSQK